MGKSKYQIKAQNKVQTQNKAPSSVPRYYDEKYISKKQKANKGFAIFAIICVLAAGGVIVGISVGNNRANDDTGTNTNTYVPTNTNTGSTNTGGDTIQITDKVTLEYTLWVDWDKDGTNDINNEDPYQGPAQLPSTAATGFIQGFTNEIIGMKVGETKVFDVPPELGYTNPSDDLYGYLLTFRVRVISIDT